MAANQTKAWFEANKPVYEREIKRPLAALVEATASRFYADGTPLTGDGKRSLFRINRDVRFSNDKSPYKTQAAAVWFRPGAGKNGAGVLYFHLAESGCFVAAAFYMPDRDVLGSIREGIRVRPALCMAMVDELAAAGLALATEDSLTRMPRGFEDLAESPIAPLLRMRHFVVQAPLLKRQVEDAALVDTLARFAHDAMPLLRFGWRCVDEVARG